MIAERGVSYYGAYDASAAGKVFERMRDDGLNAVLLAVSEFDYWFWKGAVCRVLVEAKKRGLAVYLDLWGWGKVFGGEPGSIFVQENAADVQVSSDGSRIPAACVNSGFRGFVLDRLAAICREMEFDCLFLDEPHYEHKGDAWGCFCDRCGKLFREAHGREMEREMSEDVVEFRENSMFRFLSDMVNVAKAAGRAVTICMLPFEAERRRLIGAPDWDRIAVLEADVLSTDPYWMAFGEPRAQFVTRHTKKVLEACARTGKRSQIWMQLFNVPRGREGEIADGIKLLESIEHEGRSVDSIFGWPYMAGENSILASDNPLLVYRTFLSSLTR